MEDEPATLTLEKSWVAVQVIANDPAVRTHRANVASRVLSYLEEHREIPGWAKVLCVLDDQDHEYLKQEFGGTANRGFHWPRRGQGVTLWPWYLHNIIAQVDLHTGTVSWPFESVIYLHGSTCESDIGLTLCLAHELQHFLQYSVRKALWATNSLLINLRLEAFKVWWDFPIEREARITAKHLAEDLFGAELVDAYISTRISAQITDTDAEDWKYVRSIDTSARYDLAEDTRKVAKRYRSQLYEALESRRNDPDFSEVNLDDIAGEA